MFFSQVRLLRLTSITCVMFFERFDIAEKWRIFSPQGSARCGSAARNPRHSLNDRHAASHVVISAYFGSTFSRRKRCCILRDLLTYSWHERENDSCYIETLIIEIHSSLQDPEWSCRRFVKMSVNSTKIAILHGRLTVILHIDCSCCRCHASLGNKQR